MWHFPMATGWISRPNCANATPPFQSSCLQLGTRRGRGYEARRRARAGPWRQELPLIGRSPAMELVYRTIARVVSNDLTVLILGESGTGKELVARAIHDLSP